MRYFAPVGVGTLAEAVSWFWILSALWALPVSSQAIVTVDDPSNANYLRRAFPSVVVLGDYLYIDTGEISQLVDGTPYIGPYASVFVNNTLSISLKEAWTNSSITYNKISRTGVPQLKDGAVWVDASAGAFYAWGGSTSFVKRPPTNEIWKFTADGQGGGAWTNTVPSSVVAFSSLVKPDLCASATGAGSGRVGYCVSGRVWRQTDPGFNFSSTDSYGIHGVVAFDMATAAVSNKSTDGLGSTGVVVGGKAVGVPFGPKKDTTGLLLVLGGAVSSAISGATETSFATVSVYDPAAEKWYSQTTTGTRPTPRSRFCAVGVTGDNGTYEVFLYGGDTHATSADSDEVYVLSLPGFIFFKAATDGSTVRADHACAVAGKRQLISVGGTNGWLGYPKSLTDPDPWTQGIGIFDMTEMKWTSGFNPNAAAYRTPDILRQWYSEGGLAQVAWSSENVKALFADGPAASSSTSPSGTGTAPASSGTSSSSSERSSGPPIGAIVGGVVGGVAFLAAIAALVAFLLLRRRRRERAQQQQEQQPYQQVQQTPPQQQQFEYMGSPHHQQQQSLVSPMTPYGSTAHKQSLVDGAYYPHHSSGVPVAELFVPPAYELPVEHDHHELSSTPGPHMPLPTSPTHTYSTDMSLTHTSPPHPP